MYLFGLNQQKYVIQNSPLYYTPLGPNDLTLFNSSHVKIHDEFKSQCRKSVCPVSSTLLSNGQTLGEYAISLIRISYLARLEKTANII
jgi:hypothetical protein